MKPEEKRRLPPELQKCDFEAKPLEGDEAGWVVDIPEDASVIVSMEVRTGNGTRENVRWGGGNQPGRWELRRIGESDNDE